MYALLEISRILHITLDAAEVRLAGSQVPYVVYADGVKRIASPEVAPAMRIAPHEWRAAVFAAAQRVHA